MNTALSRAPGDTSSRLHLLGKRTFTVAPMMDWTTRHCRYFHRQLSQNALLYTEMVTTGALIHGDVPHHLTYNDQEHPLALQLGGSNPADLATCTKLAKEWGYDEVNLNVGCPSDRVQNGAFGACLMAEPQLVKECMSAMRDAADIDVTVKHRIGIDDRDSYDAMAEFVGIVAESGVDTFIVHARKAILKGLSPKQNRDVPPLKYEYVYRLKQEFPQLEILINGGIKTHEECAEHLKHVDGVMLGREAYHSPWVLAEVDSRYYGGTDRFTERREAIEAMLPYVEQQIESGERLFHMTRHMMGLFTGLRGTKPWKRYLADHAWKPEATAQTLADSLEHAFGNPEA
ncbi:MAG: tRNA-dihydrouridine synthase A [Gammaproteobacteria bacterium]|jgi:tRNA-dihydrouridine synthase A